MDIEGSSVEVKMISNGHFDLSSGKEVQPCVNRASWCLGAGSSRAKRWAKGIKVPPGKTFQYKAQDDGYSIYIFEVGLHPRHIKSVQKSIHIYVIHNGRRLSIATLSSSCPKVRLEVMMTEGMELAHTSLRKAVYFNTFEFKAMQLHKSSFLNTNKELWVVKVKSCQESAFDPIGEGKKFHLLKAFSVHVTEEDMEVTEENISLYVRCGDKYYQIGKISPTGTSLFGRVEYDCEFSLSHTSESSDVIFIGYTVPDSTSFQLRELSHVAHQKLSLRPPRESDDPENSAYQELSAKRAAKLEGVTTSTRDDAEDQVLKLRNISLVPAPVISGTRNKRKASPSLRVKSKANKKVKNNMEVQAISEVVVACSPNIPHRYGCLLRNISFLLRCENQGCAFECPGNKIDTFLRWRGCKFCFFFEWLEKDRKMLCQMLNPVAGVRVSFQVNPAFAPKLQQEKVKCAGLSFSSNFCCDDTWAAVKQVLMGMFNAQDVAPEAPDCLYVFTRIDDSVYIRTMKVDSIPAKNKDDKLVLSEVGPSFCLKLLDVKYSQGPRLTSDRVCDVSQSQKLKLDLAPTVYQCMSPDEIGSCILHTVSFGSTHLMILLESGMNLSEYEDFSLSLLEFLEKESFLKTKLIIGSENSQKCTFVRNIGKSIIRSMLLELIRLFASGKCIKVETDVLGHSQILLKGSSIKFYGVKLDKYKEDQAEENVVQIVKLIEECFPSGKIPRDLQEMLDFVREDPLQNLEVAKDDCCLSSAIERRELLVSLHTEYMTNVRPSFSGTSVHGSFFSKCPYLNNWIDKVKRNRFLQKVANLETKKVRHLIKNAEDAKRPGMKKKKVISAVTKGELLFNLMRNSHTHIPEKACKDGLKSFRLSWSDYILTAYFWKYLPFIQKRMAPYLKSKRGIHGLN